MYLNKARFLLGLSLLLTSSQHSTVQSAPVPPALLLVTGAAGLTVGVAIGASVAITYCKRQQELASIPYQFALMQTQHGHFFQNFNPDEALKKGSATLTTYCHQLQSDAYKVAAWIKTQQGALPPEMKQFLQKAHHGLKTIHQSAQYREEQILADEQKILKFLQGKIGLATAELTAIEKKLTDTKTELIRTQAQLAKILNCSEWTKYHRYLYTEDINNGLREEIAIHLNRINALEAKMRELNDTVADLSKQNEEQKRQLALYKKQSDRFKTERDAAQKELARFKEQYPRTAAYLSKPWKQPKNPQGPQTNGEHPNPRTPTTPTAQNPNPR